MIKQYKQKPKIVVKAVRFMGDNSKEVGRFCKATAIQIEGKSLILLRRHGDTIVSSGDYVVRDQDRIFIVNPKTFKRFYEEKK